MGRTARETAIDYARGMGGGLIVGLPLLMTMEMWWSGFYMPVGRRLALLAFTLATLLVLEHYSGFREDETFIDEAEDAATALGLGLFLSAVVLFLLDLLEPGMPREEIVGKILLEAIPVSVGASISISQLGSGAASRTRQRKAAAGFWGSQSEAVAGAVVFGINIAPTEEPMIIGFRMEWWHALTLLLISLAQVHALVYAVEFRGGASRSERRTLWQVFLRESVTSYAAAVLVAALFLWAFGRIGPDVGLAVSVHMVIALGFVTSLGAAAAKVLL